jgi:RNA polymerase sigma-70 factor (ECF subfamily)
MQTSTHGTAVEVSFEDFYRTRSPGLFRYATVVAGPGLAEDACQDAWLRMWRAWGSADAERLDAWARQVVRNCCLDRRMARAEATVDTIEGPATDPQPDELVVRRAEADALNAHFLRLPSHLRDVLTLRELMGLSYAEIAETLHIPIGTVMSRLHSARRKLARKLVG